MNNFMPKKCDNLDEIDIFLERDKLPKLIQEKDRKSE